MHLVEKFLNNAVRVAAGPVETPVAEVKEEIINTTQEGKMDVLLREIEKRRGRILIFTKTRSRADRVASVLFRKGCKVVCLHSGRTNGQRKDALRKYHMGTHPIMVATDLAGRGIDVADIEHVINYDVPNSREDYIHRIGRTARWGKSGTR